MAVRLVKSRKLDYISPSLTNGHNGLQVVVKFYLQALLRGFEDYRIGDKAFDCVFQARNDGKTRVDEGLLGCQHNTLSLRVDNEYLEHSEYGQE